MEIKVGMCYTSKTEVNDALSASAMGSGDMPVFATPAMVALMENAAMLCVAPALEEGMSTVGIELSTSHVKATALGKSVEAEAIVTAVDGRKISFSIEAREEGVVIGKATHDRFIVNREKFLAKL